MSDSVRILPAFMWQCPRCAAVNFQAMEVCTDPDIIADVLEQEAEDNAGEEWKGKAQRESEFDIVGAPEAVVCHGCKAIFKVDFGE